LTNTRRASCARSACASSRISAFVPHIRHSYMHTRCASGRTGRARILSHLARRHQDGDQQAIIIYIHTFIHSFSWMPNEFWLRSDILVRIRTCMSIYEVLSVITAQHNSLTRPFNDKNVWSLVICYNCALKFHAIYLSCDPMALPLAQGLDFVSVA
jgi:hypothetical protein